MSSALWLRLIDSTILVSCALVASVFLVHYGYIKADGPARRGCFLLTAFLVIFALSEAGSCYLRSCGHEQAAGLLKLCGGITLLVLTACIALNHPHAPDLRGVRRLELHAQELERRVLELNLDLDKIKRAQSLRNDTIASISLELRSPLSSIICLNELLLNTVLTSEQKELLLAAQESGQTLLSHLNDIADLAQVEEDGLRLRLSTLVVGQIIREALAACSEDARRKRLSLNSDIDPHIPADLSGDAQRLKQVLIYLTRHAIRRTDKGGITIGAYADVQSPSSTVRYVITGTESALTEDDKRQLYELFPDGASTRRYGDWALQLYLGRRLIDLMGGRLCTTDRQPADVLFSFTVPLTVAAEMAMRRT